MGLKLLPDWLDSPEQVESISVLIDVLLCQVLAVREIVLSLVHLHREREPSLLSYAARGPDNFALGSLRHIEAHSQDPQSSGNTVDRASLTALLRHAPALRRLRVGFCGGMPPQEIVQIVLPELRDLHLFEVLDMDLAVIAKGCPRLQSCRIGPGVMVSPSLAQKVRGISARHFSRGPALLPLRTTLQNLDIDTSNLTAQDGCALPDMNRFSALRSLRWIFSEWPHGDNALLLDKIPPVIESLCLGGPSMPVYDVEVLIHKRVLSGRLPGLRYFRYSMLEDTKLELGMVETVVRLFE